MAKHFHTVRRVEFRETDAAGIAHFSAFFGYMEEVEHALLRSLGTSVLAETPEGTISWPRVAAQCEYTGSVKFEDLLDVELWIAHLGSKSIRYTVRFSLEGQDVAIGSLTAVCCRIAPGGEMHSITIADELRQQLAEYYESDAA